MNRFHLLGIAGLLALSSISRWDESARTGTSPALKGGEVEFIYLANEGFLVRSRERAFVIDAFLKEPLGFYAALSPELHAKLVVAEAPFDDIDLARIIHEDAAQTRRPAGFAVLSASGGTSRALASSRPVRVASGANAREAPPEAESTRFGSRFMNYPG